jgi:hypothetical protein
VARVRGGRGWPKGWAVGPSGVDAYDALDELVPTLVDRPLVLEAAVVPEATFEP